MAATTKLLLSVCGFVCIWSVGCATASPFLGSGQALGYEEEEERLMGWQGESFDPVRVFGPREPHNAKEKSWVEVVSWKPRAFVYHNFLSDEECNHIIRLAAPQMKRSEVEPDDDEEDDAESDKSVITKHRTSYGMFIRRMFDPVVERLEERLANWTHLPLVNQEDIQVLRYTHGQKYAPHYDSLGRVATVLVYLTDTEEGGETAFPQESEWVDPTLADSFGPFSDCATGHVGVRPKKGTALLFFSLLPDGKTEDPASLHTGCPVLRGVKWTATIWIHAEPFRPDYLEQELEHPPEPLADPGLCEDSYERCLEWAQQGECENNPDFMTEFCRQGCGLCEPCANSDRDCYMKNREAAGYLTLDDEVEKLTGFRIGPYHARSQAHHRRQHHHHHHHH